MVRTDSLVPLLCIDVRTPFLVIGSNSVKAVNTATYGTERGKTLRRNEKLCYFVFFQ